ncbi:hypothetical protein KRZ98_16845 [Sphingobium sp. AS12]|uniref:hypothetical protein n=1 Tax=Sphingobium sp. AS12 TaxID=2849495 RepID=UPI001C31CA15|nr:hypothetical protein [Sphingobium sp. AS12]MBV2149914.1 hypothetical protein [Sphingobium sp. AS12]
MSSPDFRVDDPAQAEVIAVGDFVRSYDFEAHADCYVEGVVDEVGKIVEGCPRYVIRGHRRIWSGRELTLPAEAIFMPPVNGTRVLGGGYCNGVRKVARP